MRWVFVFITFCLFAEPKTIAIFTFGVDNGSRWDPDSTQTGITGSEEAIIYLSKELANLNYRVTVFARPPFNSPHSRPEANPRYLEKPTGEHFDIGIAWRLPVSYQIKECCSRVYFWPHDTYISALEQEQADGFDDVLWLSKWQRSHWISMNPKYEKFQNIFGNGIIPEQFSSIQPRENPYSCIYGSNYSRGLEILLTIWPQVRQVFPKATLDIYYGWQHWGTLTPEKEASMRQKVKELASHGVTDHGLVGHQELNEAYGKASFWTYPCIGAETFCITALRAQLSGAVPVIIEGTALSETVRGGYRCKSEKEYLSLLLLALFQAEKIDLKTRRGLGDFIKEEFTWEVIAKKLKAQLN